MVPLAITAPDIFTTLLLAVAIGLGLAFEMVNGFHDTANAVATVIYTNTLKPGVAVVWSGICNFLGVLASRGLVAYTIVALLPVELVINVGSGSGFAMIFAILVSAIIWNLGTWYLGLPASSSHTLIGAIIGVGVAYSVMTHGGIGQGINWEEVRKVGLTLFWSPVFGFVGAAVLLALFRIFANEDFLQSPDKGKPPPPWIRAILIGTCTGVSFFHGSNDGQKGQGLLVLILIAILPGVYALKMNENPEGVRKIAAGAQTAGLIFEKNAQGATVGNNQIEPELAAYIKTGKATGMTYAALAGACDSVRQWLGGVDSFGSLKDDDRAIVRSDLYLIGSAISRLGRDNTVTDQTGMKALQAFGDDVDSATKYIPLWVKAAVALALGIGTMVGWKRIVVTVGEKIGKTHLNYAQGASAELMAMATIGLADQWGLPVSTTHVLSSGVAGAMFANKSGLQMKTLRNILLAWVLTLPVCVLLGSMLFAFGNFLVFYHVFGLK